MQPLTTSKRRGLLRISLCTCAAAAALLPVAVPSSLPASGEANAAGRPIVPATPGALVYPSIQIARDPFARQGTATIQAVVRAVVLGNDPKALVDVAGRSELLSIGSPLGNASVSAITQSGIELDDGSVLTIAEPQR